MLSISCPVYGQLFNNFLKLYDHDPAPHRCYQQDLGRHVPQHILHVVQDYNVSITQYHFWNNPAMGVQQFTPLM